MEEVVAVEYQCIHHSKLENALSDYAFKDLRHGTAEVREVFFLQYDSGLQKVVFISAGSKKQS